MPQSHAEYLLSLNSATIGAVSYYNLQRAALYIERLEAVAEECTRMTQTLPQHLVKMAREALE